MFAASRLTKGVCVWGGGDPDCSMSAVDGARLLKTKQTEQKCVGIIFRTKWSLFETSLLTVQMAIKRFFYSFTVHRLAAS